MSSSSYYDVLRVEKSATSDEVKRAYRKKALEAHPDKGGSAERISELNEAYSVLSDSVKRQQYDTEGKVDTMVPPVDPFQFFRDLFTHQDAELHSFTRRKPATQRRVQRPEDICSSVCVPYAQLFHGCTKKLAVRRQRFCSACHGQGARCTTCNGQGKTFATVSNTMGDMITSSFCTACSGSGVRPPTCDTCKGRRMVEERAIVQLVIEPGTPDGWQACCVGEGNDSPLAMGARGDVLLRVTSALPPHWTRDGQHLLYRSTIGLGECVSGHALHVDHVSGDRFAVEIQDVIRPALVVNGDLLAVWVVDGKGMPGFHDTPTGNLYLVFHVRFPDRPLHFPSQSSELFQCTWNEPDTSVVQVRRANAKEHEWVHSLHDLKRTTFHV